MTAAGEFNVVKSPCFLQYPGGVYISNRGTVANVIDQDARMVYQFKLPITPSSTPFNALGPTPIIDGYGDPDAGGMNSKDSSMIIGDGYGWDDVGEVSSNSWSVATNEELVETGVEAAGFTPSDKAAKTKRSISRSGGGWK